MSDPGIFLDPIAEVRHLIGDTDLDEPQLTETEIAYELGQSSGNISGAVLGCLKALMARYASMADTTELDLSVRASQLYDHYKDLLTTFNNSFSGNSGGVVPYAGGISRSDILAGRQNRDRRAGIFDRTNSFRSSDWGGMT